MRTLLVVVDPEPGGYVTELAQAARRGLVSAGHEVRELDLYELGFAACMSPVERAAYHEAEPIVDDQIREHAELLRWARALVFVFPTWWYGLPAVLKAWIERVMVPGVAFHLDPRTHKVVGGLRHVHRLAAVTVYGPRRAKVWLVNDAGRRTLARTIRLNCHWRCRTRWIAQYGADGLRSADRQRFVTRVEARLAAL